MFWQSLNSASGLLQAARHFISHCTIFLLDDAALQHNCRHDLRVCFATMMDGMTIRKLWPADRERLRAHFGRLDPETLRMRFGGMPDAGFIDAYIAVLYQLGTAVFGAFIGGELRATAELRPILPSRPGEAEAAFAVEKPYQDKGLGSALMDRILTAAQNRGVARLHMICLSENIRMRRLAGKFGARIKVADGEVSGRLDPPYPTPISLLDELFFEARGFATAVFDWPR
jgi:GNAT superfamily N-acetyltransferase